MSLLDSAIRRDIVHSDDNDRYELTMEWTLDIRETEDRHSDIIGNAGCTVFYRSDDNEDQVNNGWRRSLYIEDLYTDVPGYGSRLFEAVLEYLDFTYPLIPIVLNDGSVVEVDGRTTPLWIITLLRHGEFSYYQRFGFRPYPPDNDPLWFNDRSLIIRYGRYSRLIKSISSANAVQSLNRYRRRDVLTPRDFVASLPSYSYNSVTEGATRWIEPLLGVLSGRDDKLMIDEIRQSNIDLAELKIDEVEFSQFILSEWGIIAPNEEMMWVRQAYPTQLHLAM